MSTKLLQGCSYTELWVYPSDWKKNNDLSLDWRVECKFYDPEFKQKYPDGFRFRRRVNKFKTIKDRREIQKMIRKEISLVIGFIKQQDKYNEILWKIDNNSEDVMHPMQMHYIILYEYLIMIIEHFGINRDEIDQWIRKNISVSDALQFQESVHLSETMNYFK